MATDAEMSAARLRVCQSAQLSAEHFSGMHNWYACSHARPTYCNVCREALSGVTSHGLSCEGRFAANANANAAVLDAAGRSPKRRRSKLSGLNRQNLGTRMRFLSPRTTVTHLERKRAAAL